MIDDMDVLEVVRRVGRVAWRAEHEWVLGVVNVSIDESVCLKRWDERKD